MLEHLVGDLSCPYCDKPAEDCTNCGGVVHFEIFEKQEKGFVVALEEADCDSCGPDYTI